MLSTITRQRDVCYKYFYIEKIETYKELIKFCVISKKNRTILPKIRPKT